MICQVPLVYLFLFKHSQKLPMSNLTKKKKITLEKNPLKQHWKNKKKTIGKKPVLFPFFRVI